MGKKVYPDKCLKMDRRDANDENQSSMSSTAEKSQNANASKQFEKFVKERKSHVTAWVKANFNGLHIDTKVTETIEKDWKSMTLAEKQFYNEDVSIVTPFMRFVVECVRDKKSNGLYCYGQWIQHCIDEDKASKKAKRRIYESNKGKMQRLMAKRCGTCKGCKNFEMKSDCKKCKNCLDQAQYGGSRKLHRMCQRRMNLQKKLQATKASKEQIAKSFECQNPKDARRERNNKGQFQRKNKVPHKIRIKRDSKPDDDEVYVMNNILGENEYENEDAEFISEEFVSEFRGIRPVN